MVRFGSTRYVEPNLIIVIMLPWKQKKRSTNNQVMTRENQTNMRLAIEFTESYR